MIFIFFLMYSLHEPPFQASSSPIPRTRECAAVALKLYQSYLLTCMSAYKVTKWGPGLTEKVHKGQTQPYHKINRTWWDAAQNVLFRMSLWPQNIDHKSILLFERKLRDGLLLRSILKTFFSTVQLYVSQFRDGNFMYLNVISFFFTLCNLIMYFNSVEYTTLPALILIMLK